MEQPVQRRIVSRRRGVTFLIAGLILLAGHGIWQFHDALFLAALVLAAGMVWSMPSRNAWLVALFIASAGLGWSSIDPRECSLWWRGRLFYEKMAGNLPYVPWGQIQHKAFSPCCSFYHVEPDVQRRIQLLGEKSLEGRKLELYQTPLGPFWIAAPGNDQLAWLIWEMTWQRDYESGQVAVRPGDIVIDASAHVGVFTRHALERGAARVIALEPEPTNLACLESNLSIEVAAGRATLIKADIGNEKAAMPVATLDDIVRELQLERVDFIRMEVKGAERRALAGACQTIGRFKPRMAISSYHLRDDPSAIPAVVATLHPAYRIHAKDFEEGKRRLITKVLFFE